MRTNQQKKATERRLDQFHGIGAAFFPEHHPRETWPEYVSLISEAGLSFVRMAEFAWDKLEPREGEYDFAWLDEVMGMLDEKGVRVILCTPTAVPPIWACEKYPDMLPVRDDGKTFGFGLRRYTCPTSASYRTLCRRIVGQMARRYGNSPQILGWQLDNEIGHPFCYCPRCLAHFQEWCRERYGTIESFNEALCTHFLGQTVAEFSQIPFPTTYPHPGLRLIYHQFFSDVTIACFRLQVDTLKENGVSAPITTNMMATWYGYEHEKMGKYLDVAAGDYYSLNPDVLFGRGIAGQMFAHAYYRATKPGHNLWLHEFQCGRAGGDSVLALPGQTRWSALTQIGLGTDVVNFFRFDTCPSGLERNSFGLISVPRRPGRIYRELQQLAGDLRRIKPLLDGSLPPRPEVAFLFSFSTHCDFANSAKHPEFQAFAGNGYGIHVSRHFRAIARQNIPCNIVYTDQDLSPYKVIVAPALYVVPEALARELEGFVAQGGTLLLTSFSGLADENGRIWNVPVPANLARVFGIEVNDYGGYYDEAGTVRVVPSHKGFRFAPVEEVKWVDEISPVSATVEILARFQSPFYDGTPALTRNRHKAGWALYLGTMLSQNGYNELYKALVTLLELEPAVKLPQGLYATVRRKGDKNIYFLNNPGATVRETELPHKFHDLLSERILEGSVTLKPFEVIVATDSPQ